MFKSRCPDQNGAVAQLEEHNAGSVGVEGSSPFSSTIYLRKYNFRMCFFFEKRGKGYPIDYSDTYVLVL